MNYVAEYLALPGRWAMRELWWSRAVAAFPPYAEYAEDSVDVDALYKKIGQLEVERDFLASRPGIISHLNRDGR